MFSNFTTAVFSGSGITLALFYVMQLLITMQPGVVGEPRIRHELDWVTPPRPDDPVQSIWNTKPEPIKSPPVLPEPVANSGENSTGYKVPSPPPELPQGGNKGIEFSVSDRMLVNIVRVRPVYPAIAEARGLEGYVVVQFDVMANGSVANVSVVESSSRIFERSAIEAAKRFRYRASVVEGVPEPTYGIQYAFRFEME